MQAPASAGSGATSAGRRDDQPRPMGHVFVGSPTLSAQRGPVRQAKPFDDGFRPFYLGGTVFGAVAVILWLGAWYHGYMPPSLAALLWHVHEMVFGFAVAIIVGFLFTAARNWTGLPLPSGVSLAVVFGLWVAARFGMYFAYSPASAAVDVLVLLILAGVLGVRFVRARRWGTMPLVAVLLALGLTNGMFHAAALGWIEASPLAMGEVGLLLVVLIQMIVGGRVVPGFTASAIPGVRQVRPRSLHVGCFVLTALALVSDAARLGPVWTGMLACAAGLAVTAQAAGWNPIAALGRPMVLVLHVSYAWIPVGLVLLGLSALGEVPRSAAMHALAVGSMGGLIISMVTRTALGHSGRPVRAGRVEVVMFALVHIAAGARVAAALVPAVYMWGLASAGVAWAAAFLLYAISYAPMLLGARSRAPAQRAKAATGAP
ncbi:MAG: NnrS family protein [Leptolyngbya sp. PLA1]|nr:NnrS family protein [Leptolyngbya sp. PLA1]